MVNKPLIGPCFWGGYVRGGRLTSFNKYTSLMDAMGSHHQYNSFHSSLSRSGRDMAVEVLLPMMQDFSR